MIEAFDPTPSLLAKLGSIAGHTEEFLSSDGHDFDRLALLSLLKDPEVVEWMKQMRAMQMVPEARNKR